MARRMILTLTAGLLALLAAGADALVSAHPEGLQNWMIERSFELANPATKSERKQASSLVRAGAAFAKESASVADDAKAAFKAVKRMDKWFDGETEYDAAADDMLDAFAADAATRRASLAAIAAQFASAKVGGKVDRHAGNAGGLLERAAGSTGRVKRARFVWLAYKKLALAEKKALGGALEGDDKFVVLGGENNLPPRAFAAARQVDSQTLSVAPGGLARTEWEDGDTEGAIGNWLLIANWSDLDMDGVVDRARVSFFRRIGAGDRVLAWYLDSAPLGLAAHGISVDQSVAGTRVTFEGTELDESAGTSNEAEGRLELNGRLLVQIP